MHHKRLVGRNPSLEASKLVLALILAASASRDAARAQAAPETAQIQDVRVGADVNDAGLTRQEEKVLVKTPRSGDFVSGQKAQVEHLERLSDFSQLVPNYRPNVSNPQTSRPAIRGVGQGAGTGNGSENDTGFIIDNVFWKAVGFQWSDFVEIENFELGLGPQGTAGGKNTTVGNIIVRTQLPSFERKATFETSFGNHTHLIEKLNVTGPIIDEKLAYRVTFFYDKDNGFVKDQVTGAGISNANRWGARGQLYYVGEDVTDRLIFSYARSAEYNNNNSGPFSDSLQIFANGTVASSYSSTLFRRLGRMVLTFDRYRPYYTHLGTLSSRTITASNELNWQIGENTFTSISAWGEFRLLPYNNTGNQLIDISDSHTNQWTDQFSQEFRLTSPKDQPLEWSVGLFGLYEKVFNYSETEYGSDAAQWFGTPTTDKGLLWGVDYHTNGKALTINGAAYGQATYHVDEQLALTFGLRNGYEVKGGSNFGWIQPGYLSGNFTLQQLANAVRGASSTQQFFDTGGTSKGANLLTGIFNPSYRYNDNILVYGLVGRGEKASAVNFAVPIYESTNAFKGFQPILTKREVSWDYELGAKTNWFDGKLIANINLYWNDLYNFQSNQTDTSYVDATGAPIRSTYLGSVPHVRLKGVEFTGRWNPIERLWINASGAFTEARYVSYPDAAPPADWIWTTNINGVKPPLTISRSNTRWENLPIWAFNIGANYEHPLGAAFAEWGEWTKQPVTAFGYVNASWSDKILFTSPVATNTYWQAPFTILNTGFGLRSDDERWSISFWVKNLLDRREVTNATTSTNTNAANNNSGWSPGSATTPATMAFTNQPRSFGGSLLVKLY
ncbi:iron complex outermembrane receptor protein [Methylosinus sp. sav-2]|uniref:TonB-dependent receptor n=1 Tax=Methylosinus sp. sav-2 TaxID=2485168 RepID=UPI00055E664B|nr:TonB-dependent receptor [Methylosinus sp. sav-2]TDX64927.1 iron complex outermembrane receptor protein [Methylosinus sp. sav-2]